MSKRIWQAAGGAACVLVFGVLLLFQKGSGSPADPAPAPPAPAEPADALVHFVIDPYLQFPTRESMVIMWETSVPATSVVEYGTISNAMEQVGQKEFTTIHEVPLAGLKPNTKY